MTTFMRAAPGRLRIGDYVFASKWSNADPRDPWAVGHVTAITETHITVSCENGKRDYRWYRVITDFQGERILRDYTEMERDRTVRVSQIAEIFGLSVNYVCKFYGRNWL